MLTTDRNLPGIAWILWCITLGCIGWRLHDPILYQPIYIWVIGTIIFESIMVVLCSLLANILTSIFFWRYPMPFSNAHDIAFSMRFNTSPNGEKCHSIFTIIFYIVVNIWIANELFNLTKILL